MPKTIDKEGNKTKKTVARVVIDPQVRAKQVQDVLDLMEQGNSENKSCQIVKIHRQTFRSFINKHELDGEYARAMKSLAEEQIHLVEKTLSDMRLGIVDANMARVEIDARKWFASKFLPRKYGDKLDVTSDGKAITQPMLQSVSIRPPAIEGEVVPKPEQR